MQRNTIELKGLAFYAHHGATEEESRLGQRFFLDVFLELPGELRFRDDDLGKTVNYAEVYAVIEKAFTDTRYKLIESAGEMIADAVLNKFELVKSIRVRVEKPAVPVDCICEHFAVEVARCR